MGQKAKSGDKRIGNQFWKLRSKHGRDRIIKSPEALWESACNYFEYCVDNPILVHEVRGKDAKDVYIQKPRVFQKGELALHCGVCEWGVINDLKNVSEDFLQAITRIETIIRAQKYQYAVINVFNANIVASDLGLKRKIEMEDKIDITQITGMRIVSYEEDN